MKHYQDFLYRLLGWVIFVSVVRLLLNLFGVVDLSTPVVITDAVLIIGSAIGRTEIERRRDKAGS